MTRTPGPVLEHTRDTLRVASEASELEPGGPGLEDDGLQSTPTEPNSDSESTPAAMTSLRHWQWRGVETHNVLLVRVVSTYRLLLGVCRRSAAVVFTWRYFLGVAAEVNLEMR